jgi:RNA polymerase sigma-70 factor (ECF subfamily)
MIRPSPQPAANSVSPEICDLDAVAEVAGGNREMFEVIVRRHNPRLFRVGMAYLGSHAQAEDAMQNAYLKAFLNLGSFQRGAAFGTWLTRIMINECLMALRRRRLVSAAADKVPAAELDTETPGAADTMTLKEMKALLEKAIAALPQNYRVVYMLREVQQLSTAETAACLGLSVDTVKVRLLRARDRLKTELLKSAAGAELFPYPARHCDPLTARVMETVLAVA